MKTALTQLIEKWESEMGSYIPNAPIYKAFIEEAKERLEAEKNQIMEAFNNGLEEGQWDEPDERTTAQEYFIKTFKSTA